MGSAHHENASGDEQKKLDVVANEIFVTHLEYGSIVTLAASEELDEPAVFATERERGSYVICFDPIDGSSNLDVNGTLGTIFGIRRKKTGSLDDLMTSGRDQVAAGYILFGPATEFVLAVGGSVSAFTYERGRRRILSHARRPADAEKREELRRQRGEQPFLAETAPAGSSSI